VPLTRLPATGGGVDGTALALLVIALGVRLSVKRQRGAKSDPGA
jgi:hypothetical protein